MPQPIFSPLRGKRAEVALPALLAPTLPIHHMRVEPIFHTGSLLFAIDDPPVAEVVNDTGGVLADFWRTMRDESAFKDFAKLCNSTPYSEAAFLEARMVLEDSDPVRRAWAMFVLNRMGTLENSSRLATISKKRTRRAMTEQAASFLSVVDMLPQFHERFRSVTHISRDPLAVVREFDQHDVLIVITPQASKPGFRTLGELFGSDDPGYDFDVRHTLNNLTAFAMVVIESGHPVDKVFESMWWHRLDFETRTWHSWARKPPRPARLWSNFHFARETECGQPVHKARIFL